MLQPLINNVSAKLHFPWSEGIDRLVLLFRFCGPPLPLAADYNHPLPSFQAVKCSNGISRSVFLQV
jgi:hypothetical protein